MSKYTTEVRFICEQASGLTESKGYNDTNSIIDLAIPKVFNFDFPIFDEEYRGVLERKILKHFYTREIGEETVGLWKLRLDTRLNEIMPYYNKLYKSELLEFNPLYTVDLTRTRKTDFDKSESDDETIADTTTNTSTSTETENSNSDKTNTNVITNSGSDTVNNDNRNTVTNSGKDTITTSTSGTTNRTDENTTDGTDNGTSTNDSTNKYSDTPQGTLTNVESGTYLTNATKIDESGTTTSSTHNESTNKSVITSNDSGTNKTEFGKETVSVDDGSSVTTYGKIVNGSETETIENKRNNNKNDRNEGAYNRSRGNKNDVTSTEDYLERVSGYEGAIPSDLLQKYRETFLNIDMMVINNLEDLFFQLW